MKGKMIVLKRQRLLVVLAALTISLMTACADKQEKETAEMKWKEQEILRSHPAEDVSKIEFTTHTEDGVRNGSTESKDEIKEIYDALLNVTIGSPTQMAVIDDSLFLDVYLGDETLHFVFEHDILILDDERYETAQTKPLKTIVERMLNE